MYTYVMYIQCYPRNCVTVRMYMAFLIKSGGLAFNTLTVEPASTAKAIRLAKQKFDVKIYWIVLFTQF